jgi:hypothetical protein
MSRNPGFGARKGSVDAALAASKAGRAEEQHPDTSEKIVGLSLRLDEPTYRRLKKLAFDRDVKMHTIILDSVTRTLDEADQKAK